MTTVAKNATPTPRIDPAAFFKKLGLTVADERPIMATWREANARWRRDRANQIAAQARRVDDHLRRFRRFRKNAIALSRATMGRPRAVWCVELRRRFGTMTEAAKFVGRTAGNISQALKRGVRCGPYHWEAFDSRDHRAGDKE